MSVEMATAAFLAGMKLDNEFHTQIMLLATHTDCIPRKYHTQKLMKLIEVTNY